jgi:DNA adenine methylase
LSSQVTRPALRYYGGKFRLAPWIISFFPKHRLYVEPFGCGASVLLLKQPALVEIYNDISDEIVNLFRVLRCPEDSKRLITALELTPYSRTEWLSAFELSTDPIEQARRTIIMANMSHNASKVMLRQANGFRVATTGYHRLPQDFRRHTEHLQQITNRLRDVVIENRDYRKILEANDRPNTLFYLDPPYMLSTRACARKSYYAEFDEKDHIEFLQIITKLKGNVVLSGYPSQLYQDSLVGWHSFSMQSNTAAALPGKSLRTEVLWLNPAAYEGYHTPKLFPA